MSETETVDQALEQSMEQRIANQFGIEDDQPETPEENIKPEGEDAPEPSEVEVEYNGEKFKIPKQLEKAILQERDYTHKTQELAEQRRQVEHEKQVVKAHKMEREFLEEIDPEVKQLSALDNYLKHLEGIDVRTLDLDSQIAHLAELQRIPRQREAVQNIINGKRQKFDEQVKEMVESIRKNAKDVLSKSIPGFNDELYGSISTYAKSLGFSEQDTDGIVSDPRSSSVLFKAMKYDQLQANKSEAVKKATAASPAIKPGSSNPMPQQVKDKLAFNKAMKSAPNSQAKARLIEERLARSF